MSVSATSRAGTGRAVTVDRPTSGTTPTELGIGARVSIHPHGDGFVDVILGALDDAARAGATEGLRLTTDEVSTYVGAVAAPAEQRLAKYLTAVVAAASRRAGGAHVVAHVLLSRGCPGEVTCDLTVTGLPAPDPVHLPATGVPAVAQWSLYPLIDGGSHEGDHMAHIEYAIRSAQRRGTAATPAHYATMLRGDLADVLATAVDAWAAVGAEVAHVVSHLTVSIASPSTTELDAAATPGTDGADR